MPDVRCAICNRQEIWQHAERAKGQAGQPVLCARATAKSMWISSAAPKLVVPATAVGR